MTTTFREWTKRKIGVSVRAMLTKDMPYQASDDSDVEYGDLWVLFVSIESNDHWLAYGIVDRLVGEPELSLHNQDIEQLKKLSILIGDQWMRIEGEPVIRAQKHRKLANDIQVVIDDVMAMTYTELLDKRTASDWETMQNLWRQRGIKLSLN